MTHICVSKQTGISSDNALSPGRRQSIIWTHAVILLNGHLGTNFNEILIKIHTFLFKKVHWKMASGKWRPFFLSLNVLSHQYALDLHPCCADLSNWWVSFKETAVTTACYISNRITFFFAQTYRINVSLWKGHASSVSAMELFPVHLHIQWNHSR